MRRSGELLKQIDPATGKNNQYAQMKWADDHPFHSRQDAASSAGMSPHQAKQAIRVASVPAPDFDRQVDSDAPPTVTALAEQGTKPILDLKGRDPGKFNRSLQIHCRNSGGPSPERDWIR